MRLNKYIAQATGMSRRAADAVIVEERVCLNGHIASLGQEVHQNDKVTLDERTLISSPDLTLILNKPIGYVTSRNGQGSATIYDLLPEKYRHLKPVGRLDKDSSGLLLLTTDGQLAQELTHPSYKKEKTYEVTLDKPLAISDRDKLEKGIELEDGLSHLSLKVTDKAGTSWRITMTEGRNRQIRRTFAALGYKVTNLHRTRFGSYALGDAAPGKYHEVTG